MIQPSEERLKQAQELGLDQHEAIALSSRLLRELESYLDRRHKRGYHTDFDDLLATLLPGLALAISLLLSKEAVIEDIDEERWGELQPDTYQLLQRLAATLGLNYADRIADALKQEVAYTLQRLANERTDLVLLIMEWGEEQHYPHMCGDEFDIQDGLEAWCAFSGEAPIEALREAREKIRVRRLSARGRQRLAQLSGE
jgi:hypothetical protein